MSSLKTLIVFTSVLLKFVNSDPLIENFQYKSTYEMLCKVETGFEDECNNKNLSPNLGKDDIKLLSIYRQYNIMCSFKLIAVSFLTISGQLLKANDDENRIKTVVDRVMSFTAQARLMLIILYNIRNTSLYEWWLLYMYLSELKIYFEVIWNNGIRGNYLIERLNNMRMTVIDVLQRSKGKCHGERHQYFIANVDKSYWYKKFQVVYHIPEENKYEAAEQLLTEYELEVGKIMNSNALIEVGWRNTKTIHLQCLYLNDASIDEVTLNNLQIYDSNIEWNKVTNEIRKTFNQAKGNPMSLHDGFERIKKYHDKYKAMLKIIMLRITWTHVLLLNDIIKNHSEYSNDDQKLIVNDYVTKLSRNLVAIWVNFFKNTGIQGLTSEYEIINIVGLLKGNSNVKVNSIVFLEDTIKSALVLMALNFKDLQVTENIINSKELPKLYDNLLIFAKENDLSTDYKQIKNIPLEYLNQNFVRAAVFVNHVTKIFQNIDFDMTHSLFQQGKLYVTKTSNQNITI